MEEILRNIRNNWGKRLEEKPYKAEIFQSELNNILSNENFFVDCLRIKKEKTIRTLKLNRRVLELKINQQLSKLFDS